MRYADAEQEEIKDTTMCESILKLVESIAIIIVAIYVI